MGAPRAVRQEAVWALTVFARRPNKRLELTKRGLPVGGPALARRRRANFVESRFAAQAWCSTELCAD